MLAAIAHARPGGVAYHCGIGRDRTGLVTMLVLAFAGVPPELVTEDYALSDERVPRSRELDAFHAELGTTPAEVFAGVLAGLDAEAYLRAAGLGVGDLAALRPATLNPPKGSDPVAQCCWSPVAAGGRDSSASEVIVSWPRAASSSTPVASSAERA